MPSNPIDAFMQKQSVSTKASPQQGKQSHGKQQQGKHRQQQQQRRSTPQQPLAHGKAASWSQPAGGRAPAQQQQQQHQGQQRRQGGKSAVKQKRALAVASRTPFRKALSAARGSAGAKGASGGRGGGGRSSGRSSNVKNRESAAASTTPEKASADNIWGDDHSSLGWGVPKSAASAAPAASEGWGDVDSSSAARQQWTGTDSGANSSSGVDEIISVAGTVEVTLPPKETYELLTDPAFLAKLHGILGHPTSGGDPQMTQLIGTVQTAFTAPGTLIDLISRMRLLQPNAAEAGPFEVRFVVSDLSSTHTLTHTLFLPLSAHLPTRRTEKDHQLRARGGGRARRCACEYSGSKS